MLVAVTSPVDVGCSAKSANTEHPGASPDGIENSPRESPPPAPSCSSGGPWLLPSGQGPKRLQEHIRGREGGPSTRYPERIFPAR